MPLIYLSTLVVVASIAFGVVLVRRGGNRGGAFLNAALAHLAMTSVLVACETWRLGIGDMLAYDNFASASVYPALMLGAVTASVSLLVTVLLAPPFLGYTTKRGVAKNAFAVASFFSLLCVTILGGVLTWHFWNATTVKRLTSSELLTSKVVPRPINTTDDAILFACGQADLRAAIEKNEWARQAKWWAAKATQSPNGWQVNLNAQPGIPKFECITTFDRQGASHDVTCKYNPRK